MHSQPMAHQIVWDEPSLAHSTWQGPPAFDFSHEHELALDIRSGNQPHPDDVSDIPQQEHSQSPVHDGDLGITSLAVPVPSAESPHASADEVVEDSLTIGRSRSNGIVLDDMLVSRRHVIITAEDDGLLLRDLGSRNGTFVNGRRIEQAQLEEGDRIGIGASTFEIRDGWLVAL